MYRLIEDQVFIKEDGGLDQQLQLGQLIEQAQKSLAQWR